MATKLLVSQVKAHDSKTVSKKARLLVDSVNEGTLESINAAVDYLDESVTNYEFKSGGYNDPDLFETERDELLNDTICKIVKNNNSNLLGIVHNAGYSNKDLDSLHLGVIVLDTEEGFFNTTWSPSNVEVVDVNAEDFLRLLKA